MEPLFKYEPSSELEPIETFEPMERLENSVAQFEQIIDEVVAEMVQPATVAEDGRLAIAMFNSEGNHVFSIQRVTDEETKKLVGELREWLRGGMERVLERAQGIAKAAGG